VKPVDRQTLAWKLEYLRKQLALLDDYRKMSKADVVGATERRYTVERLLELSIQSVIDCSRLLVGLEDWRAARDERDALLLLAERKIIDDELADRLIQAEGFRNVLVHEYIEADADLLYQHLTHDVVPETAPPPGPHDRLGGRRGASSRAGGVPAKPTDSAKRRAFGSAAGSSDRESDVIRRRGPAAAPERFVLRDWPCRWNAGSTGLTPSFFCASLQNVSRRGLNDRDHKGISGRRPWPLAWPVTAWDLPPWGKAGELGRARPTKQRAGDQPKAEGDGPLGK
jgi:uncharacterized protein YutE (UPF0331/DUF86 family)